MDSTPSINPREETQGAGPLAKRFYWSRWDIAAKEWVVVSTGYGGGDLQTHWRGDSGEEAASVAFDLQHGKE